MTLPALICYASLFCLVTIDLPQVTCGQMIANENGLLTFSKDGAKIPFAIEWEPDSSLIESATANHGDNGKSMSNVHLKSYSGSQHSNHPEPKAQQPIPILIADQYARLPYNKQPSKYLVKPIRELASSLFTRGDELATSRARRYAYAQPLSSQSFLRFGRQLVQKRPKDAKDTAFLRFGRSFGMSDRAANLAVEPVQSGFTDALPNAQQ